MASREEIFLSGGGEMDTVWLLFGSILVFFMQTGFAMLEAGMFIGLFA
jgi:hypothetical protein